MSQVRGIVPGRERSLLSLVAPAFYQQAKTVDRAFYDYNSDDGYWHTHRRKGRSIVDKKLR